MGPSDIPTSIRCLEQSLVDLRCTLSGYEPGEVATESVGDKQECGLIDRGSVADIAQVRGLVFDFRRDFEQWQRPTVFRHRRWRPRFHACAGEFAGFRVCSGLASGFRFSIESTREIVAIETPILLAIAIMVMPLFLR